MGQLKRDVFEHCTGDGRAFEPLHHAGSVLQTRVVPRASRGWHARCLPIRMEDPPMSTRDQRTITRTTVIEAAARVIARRGDHTVHWSGIASEAGNEQAVVAESWFEDRDALIDECYAHTAQAFAEALLRGETTPGTDRKSVV